MQRHIGIRTLIIGALFAGACGGGGAPTTCGGSFETSCDVPSDNGIHTCYDYDAIDATGEQQAKTTCTNQYTAGNILSTCCNHDGAIARCVFQPTMGGTSTKWFLSGTVAAAQMSCSSAAGTFTAF